MRGYLAAVLEGATREGALGAIAEELGGISTTVRTNGPLRDVLSDEGLPPHLRRQIVEDVFAGRVTTAAAHVARFLVEAERPSELVSSFDEVAERAAAEVARSAEDVLDPPASRAAIAERVSGYARARFAAGVDRPGLEELEDELFRFVRTLEANPALVEALGDPLLAPTARAGLATHLLGGKVTPLTLDLVGYAAASAEGRELTGVLEALVGQAATQLGRRVATVRSAVALEQAQRDRLSAALASAVGAEVELREELDPSLLGGFQVAFGDTQVDATLRRRLDQVERLLAAPLVATGGPGAGTPAGGGRGGGVGQDGGGSAEVGTPALASPPGAPGTGADDGGGAS